MKKYRGIKFGISIVNFGILEWCSELVATGVQLGAPVFIKITVIACNC